ncbi:MAG: HesA/MoeB/ThiF family protein [Myxococcales bacterium]|nr:HesA/MoeB/ThiF family protein [Myxococcales bacterium]
MLAIVAPGEHEGWVHVPARVCVVGVGGLGCPASLALARAGVGHLTLVDPDRVDVSNLHRQLWHHPQDVGRLKVESAGQKLRAQFPSLGLALRPGRVDASNVLALFEDHDLVIDATDGVQVKFLLSDAAVLARRPLIYGGVLRFEGLAMRVQPDGPCLRCLFETPPVDVPTCAQAGVLGSMAALVGALQATLALRPEQEKGLAWLHVLDGWTLAARTVRVRRRKDCAACGEGANPVLRDEAEAAACPTPTSTSPVRSAP